MNKKLYFLEFLKINWYAFLGGISTRKPINYIINNSVKYPTLRIAGI